jgi:hypothetical protein
MHVLLPSFRTNKGGGGTGDDKLGNASIIF